MENATVVSENRTDAEFQAARHMKIGSSDISAILGLNSYRSPLQLYCEKLGLSEESTDNKFTRAGKLLEPVVAQMFAAEKQWSITKNAMTISSGVLPDWAIATPDYFASEKPFGEAHILEIKTCHEYGRDKWFGGGEESVPDHAHCQTIWQMGITGIHRAYVACLIGGIDLVIREVKWNQGLFDTILAAVSEFYQRLVEKNPPPAVADDEALIVKLNGFDASKVVERPDLSDKLGAWHNLNETRKEHDKAARDLKKACEALEMEIREAVKDAAIVKADRWEAAIKKVPRKAYSVKESEYFTFGVKEASTDGTN